MFIAFAPVMVMLSLALGLDSLTGTAIIILGGAIGFSTGTLNASTTLVSQQIAELPPFSGIGYRFVCFGVFYVVTNIFLIRYANKVKKHPEKSPMYDLDKENEMAGKVSLEDFGTMDLRKWLVIGCLVVSLIVIIYGSIALGWDLPEYSAVFLVLAVVSGAVAGFSPNRISKEFVEGCKGMMSAAITIGLARGIGSIMADGTIVDTVVHSLASVLDPCALYPSGTWHADFQYYCFLVYQLRLRPGIRYHADHDSPGGPPGCYQTDCSAGI